MGHPRPNKRETVKRTTRKPLLDHLPTAKQDQIILARLLAEQNLPGGQTFVDLAHQYRCDMQTVRRWYLSQPEVRKQKVLAGYMERQREQEAERTAGIGMALGEDIQQDFRWVLKELRRLIDEGRDDDDKILQLSSLKETARVLEKLANLMGLMSKKVDVTIDLNTCPQFLELREVFVRVLQDHPAALADFQTEMRLLQGGQIIEHQPISA